jgi:CRP-like cAMP-binding protein
VSIDVLKKVSLLNGLDDAAFSAVMKAGERIQRVAEEFIVRQGEFGDSMFVILNGRIKIQAFQTDGLMKTIVELGPGDYFGEMAMLGLRERTASAVTSSSSELLQVRQVPFNKATKKFKQVKKRLEDVFRKRTAESFVRSCFYFRSLSEELSQQLVSLSDVKSYKKNDLIIKEGDEATQLFVIVHGFVRVSRSIEGQQKDEVLAYLSDSDFFGDQELSSAIPDYSTSVVAVEPVQALVIPRATFWRINEAFPDIFS